MEKSQPNNPLHGVTLEMMVTALQRHYGWDELGDHLGVRAFEDRPTIKSALKFFRKTPWARERLEALYLALPPSAISPPND